MGYNPAGDTLQGPLFGQVLTLSSYNKEDSRTAGSLMLELLLQWAGEMDKKHKQCTHVSGRMGRILAHEQKEAAGRMRAVQRAGGGKCLRREPEACTG